MPIKHSKAVHAMARAALLICICAATAGCPRAVQRPAPAPSVPTTPEREHEGAAEFQIDPQASELYILVFRGGALARLGHNHVMSSKSLSGRVWMHPQFERSGFEITFPVAELIVDDADARRTAGSDFPPDIADADKQGTRRNMLRTEVLDAEHYPDVRIEAAQVTGSLQAPAITARITIKSVTREVSVPVKIGVAGDRLSAVGEFELLQTYFGLVPFSVAMGALQVKDTLTIRFNIVAVER